MNEFIMNYKKITDLTCFIIILNTFFIITGCVGIQRRVQFTAQVPGKIDLTKIKRMAVLDFSMVFHNRPEQGIRLAQSITAKLRTRARLDMVPVEISRAAFREMRIPRSRFAERSVLKQLGEKLNADAILFGDLTAAQIKKYSTYKTVVRQKGVQKEAQMVIDALGNTRTIWKSIPIFVDVVQETIHRLVQVQAHARLVLIEAGFVLWEEKTHFHKSVKTTIEEGGIIQGNREADEVLLRKFIDALGERLLQEVLPRRVVRIRQLAVAEDIGKYADFIRQGTTAAYKNNWHLAGNYWLQAQALNPNRPEARANLGVLRELEGEYEQAGRDYLYAAQQLGQPWKKYLEQVKEVLKPAESD